MTERSAAVTGLDHALIGVADLEAARERFRALGFTITPRGHHFGWGTANYCIMFEGDYLELLGIVDPSAFVNNLDRFLAAHGEGLLGLAFATVDSAEAARLLATAGITVETPKHLSRALELPEGNIEPHFSLLQLPPEATPGLSAFLCQHLTRDLVWQRRWISHANGALGVRAIHGCLADPAAAAPAYGALLGENAVSLADDLLELSLGRCRLRLMSPALAAKVFPEAKPGDGPSLLALDFAVADPEASRRILGAAAERRQGWLVVPPSLACGVVLRFGESGPV